MIERTIKTVTLKDYKTRILRVLTHIQQNLDEPLSLEDLARLAHFSPFHFHRVFTGMLGESVQNHIRRLRLERAASRLKKDIESVVNVAFDAGYETHEAFTRAFKSMFGLSPSEYRMCKSIPLALKKRKPAPVVHFDSERIPHHFKTKRDTHMKITTKTITSLRVACVRHIGPYASCHIAWDKLCPFMGKEGLLGPDTRFIGICHDDPEVTPPDKIRYDACVTVDEGFKPVGGIDVQTIEGGEYAVTTHAGPYETLGKTYAKLMGQWLPRSGREPRSGPCFEIYLNDPTSTAPADLLTEIHVPLEPKREAGKRIPTSEKIDLNKLHKAEYVAPKKPVLLQIAAATYLCVNGKGAPGGEEFEKRIGALYSMAYTVKMTRKFNGEQDYTIGKLEGQWGSDKLDVCFASLPKEEWRWKLMIRTPEFVGDQELKNAARILLARGKPVEVEEVKLEAITEGLCVQMLHTGPYDQEGVTASVMLEFARKRGFVPHGLHHDIYISDPRRVAPEKLKTILRQPVEKGVSVDKPVVLRNP